MSSSSKIDNRKKDILILGKGPTQGLECTLSVEKCIQLILLKKIKRFCLSLHENRAKSYLFVNDKETHKFKAKDYEILHLEVLILETFILVLLESGTKNHGEFDQLKNIDQKYYCSSYYDVSVNKYGVKCRTMLWFWENKGWIHKIDPYSWFQWYFRSWLGGRLEDDERQVNGSKRTLSRFKGKLVKMIKDAGSKYDNYSISPKIRQILLHWGYELT